MQQKPVTEEKTVIKEEKPTQTDTVLAELFDLPKLKWALQEIVEEFKKDHKNLEITVLKQPVELQGENIIFKLVGDIQQEIFHKMRPELLGNLRRKLNNYSISLDSVVTEEQENGERKLYTNTDKLNYLREKSPALVELQKRFGLETDF